jgi:hypothetical protein
MKKILIAEISGKRPGTYKQRPTELFETCHDHIIISNNSDGYTSTWPIINVPDDYREWYVNNMKNSENAWYAPMNRSYAIKYAREHGYDYLVQLDDNIVLLEIASIKKEDGHILRRRINGIHLFDDFVTMLACVLDNTNAAMAGFDLAGISEPTTKFLSERYCYSFFMLNLSCCPDVFQGDFEDDIEYRLKCAQMGRPVVQVVPMRYGKTGQNKTKDLTGCRAEYLKKGVLRGEHMSKLYGDVYSARMRNIGHSVMARRETENANFKHDLKPWKLGVIVYDMKAMEECLANILKKYPVKIKSSCIVKEKRKKVKTERLAIANGG